MNYPKTWTILNSKDKNPEFLEIEAPVSKAVIAKYQDKVTNPNATFGFSSSRSKGSVYSEGGKWWREFRVHNPAYVAPDKIVMVYGLPCNFALVRYSGTMIWKHAVRGLQKVARVEGSSLTGKDHACIAGGYEELWDKTKFPRYEWDGEKITRK